MAEPWREGLVVQEASGRALGVAGEEEGIASFATDPGGSYTLRPAKEDAALGATR